MATPSLKIQVFTNTETGHTLTNFGPKEEFILVPDITFTVDEQTNRSDITINCEGEEAKSLRKWLPELHIVVDDETRTCISKTQNDMLPKMWLTQVDGFETIVLEEKGGCTELRTNATNEDYVKKWIAAYGKATHADFNILRAHQRKSIFRRTYICHHGDKRQSGKIKTFTG